MTGEIRRIRESDVMILVRSRNAFFEAMVRALKAAELKAAGADRLKLKDHIAVMDLIAAGRASLAAGRRSDARLVAQVAADRAR